MWGRMIEEGCYERRNGRRKLWKTIKRQKLKTVSSLITEFNNKVE